jgi:hypothetical protein
MPNSTPKDDRQAINMRLPIHLLDALRADAKVNDRSATSIIIELLDKQ